MSTFRTAAQRRAEAEAKAAAEEEARLAAAEEAGEHLEEPAVDPRAGKTAWPDSEEGPFFFSTPTSSQLGLFASRLRDGSTGTWTAAFSLVKYLLDPKQMDEFVLWAERGDIDVQDLIAGDPEYDEIEGGLIGMLSSAVAGRPTQPSSDSSPTPKPTGQASTGRARSGGSTRSTSASTAS